MVDLKGANSSSSSSSSSSGISEVVARDLVTGEVTSYAADAVVFAIGITGEWPLLVRRSLPPN